MLSISIVINESVLMYTNVLNFVISFSICVTHISTEYMCMTRIENKNENTELVLIVKEKSYG